MKSLHVLLIEDDDSDAWLLQNKLSTTGKDHYRITRTVNVENALLLIKNDTFDIAFLDMSLPGISGTAALRHLQNAAPTLPVIILTSMDDEKTALIAVQQGAQDYLIKGDGDASAIKRAASYAIERKNSLERLIRLANYDALTGLINRPFFENRLELALARARRNGQHVGVLFLDLNHFKQVNDTLGHNTGDRLLQEIGKRLQTIFRDYDTVARFGGDEFAVLLDGMTHVDDCTRTAQKIIDAFVPPIDIDGKKLLASLSIGIAFTSDAENLQPATLMKRADIAMYSTKGSNKNSYRFFEDSMLPVLRESA